MSTQPPGMPPPLTPLQPGDPPRVEGFWLDARMTSRVSGAGFSAHAEDGTPVMVILLSEGATGNPAARDRFAGAVNELDFDTVIARGGAGQDGGRLGRKFVEAADDAPAGVDEVTAPWVALHHDGTAAAAEEAERLLAVVDQAWVPQQGTPSGPDFRPHWIDQAGAGATKVWPLPWPGRHDRAGWVTVILSWLLMVMMALLAVLLVILLFKQAPPQQPPPPLPTTPPPSSQSADSQSSSSSPSPQSGSPSPSDGSPSPQSASPSPQSASPSPSDASASPSNSSSPSPSGSESASASPTPSDSASGGPGASPSQSASAASPSPDSKL